MRSLDKIHSNHWNVLVLYIYISLALICLKMLWKCMLKGAESMLKIFGLFEFVPVYECIANCTNMFMFVFAVIVDRL